MRDDECRRPPLWESREGHLASWIYNKARLLLTQHSGPTILHLTGLRPHARHPS